MWGRVALVSVSLAALASGSKLSADLASLDGEWKERPITRVVNLLKDMQAELQAEQDADQEMYDKMVCWCETNDKEKTKAIADANQAIDDLGAAIEENTALASTREVELGALAKETANLEKALSEAEALRAKELAEFNQQEKDFIQSIGSLKGAVNALSKQNGGALVQQEALLQVAQVLRRRPGMAESSVAPHLRSQVRALVDNGDMSLLQRSAVNRGQAKAQDSGAIFGILSQMKETFETNMENGKKEEAQAVEDYKSLKATKEGELKAAQDKTFTKTEELAKAKETVAQSKVALEDTRNTLASDTTFLGDLKKKCAEIDNMWEQRQKMRLEEIKAVGETISILTDDDARDTMSAAGTFIQRRAQAKLESGAKAKAVAALLESGKALNSPRLSYLAIRMRNDAFAKVEEAVDGMVGQLGVEQKDEVVKKDGCVTDFNTNDKQTAEKTEHKEDVEVEINDLTSEIKAKTEEQEALKQQISEAQIELKKASENREEENKIFQQTISDQRATQAILKKALDKMASVYAKKAAASAASLLQQAETLRRQAPPVNFAPMKKNGAGTGVLALLENIIDESKETEADAVAGENEAQTAYETFVKNTNAAIEAMSAQIVNDEDVKAKDTKKEVDDESDKRATTTDILKLGQVSGTLHEACDFTVDHFSERQKSRGDEIDALKQAKAIFHGAKF